VNGFCEALQDDHRAITGGGFVLADSTRRSCPAIYFVMRLGEIGSLAGNVSSMASSSNCS
jgi:hypothetical protein